jgi:glycosyltransferase involved in cell wall biosynthesis
MISIVIPAHNEEKYIEKCLYGIEVAKSKIPEEKVETIVVLNRCTDKTEEFAKRYKAKIVINNDKCISAIRNTGVKNSSGDIIVTIDADSIMSQNSLKEIKEYLDSGKYIGGGVIPKFDRMSFGIFCSSLYVLMNLLPVYIKNKAPLSGGMFWLYRKDFDEIGGFNEELVSLEDMDFAVRLNELGKKKHKKFGTLKDSFIVTSSRKFDEFGDWYLIKNKKLTKEIFTGKNKEASDKFYYNLRD